MNHGYSQGVLDGIQTVYNAISQQGNADILDSIDEANEHV